MGSAEIAALFDVSRQRVQQLIAKTDFPAPVADLAMGKVWATADVRAWGISTNRLASDCGRCGRNAPPADAESFADWEALEDGGWICPECITPEEQQAIDEAGMALGDELEAHGQDV